MGGGGVTRSEGPVRAAPRPRPAPSARALRQERAYSTRRALLVAAGERFAAQGYHGTALTDLLGGGSMTRGALYFHFRSKEALAEALVAAMSESWAPVLPAVIDETPDALAALVRLTDVVIVRLADPIVRGAARVLRDQVLRSPSLAEVSAGWEDEMCGLLREAREHELLRPGVRPVWVAHEIVVSLAGRGTLLESHAPQESLWEDMNDFWAGLLPLIASEPWLARWDATSWSTRPRPPLTGPSHR